MAAPMEDTAVYLQFWIVFIIVSLEIVGVKCKSEMYKVHEDILVPYLTYPGPRHSHRYARECQPLKYKNTTHQEYPPHQSDKFKEEYTVVDSRYFVTEFGEYYWDTKTVYGHQFVVSDPSKTVTVLEPKEKGGCQNSLLATVTESSNQKECFLAVNAGFFNVTSGACIGNIVSDGREAANSGGIQNAHFGIKKDGSLFFGYVGEDVDLEEEFTQLVGGVIWLVRDGENYIDISKKVECPDAQSTAQLQGFIDVTSSRIAVGHDAEGKLVIVHVEGKTWARGVNLNEFADLLLSMGVVNAINLDGGGSVTAVVNHTLINYPADTCTIGNFSYNCERNVSSILCIHDIPCDPVDCNDHGDCWHGSCHCHENWAGPRCQQLQCGSQNCSDHGQCTAYGCDCGPGWLGEQCLDICPAGRHGKNCSQPCNCERGQKCDPQDGHCVCPAGYQGYHCEHECPYGFYGEDCQAVCDCDLGCSCHPVTGNCTITNHPATLWQVGHCYGNHKIISKDMMAISNEDMQKWIVAVVVLCIFSSASVIANISLAYLYLTTRASIRRAKPNPSSKCKKTYRSHAQTGFMDGLASSIESIHPDSSEEVSGDERNLSQHSSNEQPSTSLILPNKKSDTEYKDHHHDTNT